MDEKDLVYLNQLHRKALEECNGSVVQAQLLVQKRLGDGSARHRLILRAMERALRVDNAAGSSRALH